jgi:hypothetical protein
MSSQQKRGFRLPWAAERSTDEGAAAATLEVDAADSADSTTTAQIEDGVGGELGEGPFRFADAATPDASTGDSPEAPEVPENTAEAAMIETDAGTTETTESPPPPTDKNVWGIADAATEKPTTDVDGAELVTAEQVAAEQAADESAASEAVASEAAAKPVPATRARTDADPRATRSNPLVAGLVKAMREAALASREETTSRLKGDATAQVELIREAGTSEAAELRKRADEDVAGIREWSKSEIARIKSETDERIEQRRTELDHQTKRHEARLERQVEEVQSTMAAYEAEMDRFFDRLLAENDPARLAALAEQAPEPPDLADLPSLGDDLVSDDAESPGGTEWDDVAWGTIDPEHLAAITDPAPDAAAEPAEALEAEAAAEAEAASTEGLEMPTDEVWPTSVLAAARRTLTPAKADFEAAGVANTRLFVTGLTSVAGISAFKGALGQLHGVRSVSVSSGEPGVFIFTVVHTPDTDLQDGVAGLTSFSARVTEASGGELTVVAEEPAA